MVTHHHHLSELSRCFSSSALGMVFQPLHALLWPWLRVLFSMQIHGFATTNDCGAE